MTRTWQQNSDTINGLWPHCQWTDEEIDLWRSDLAGLDQDVLFEAIREVKRSKESPYPQLAWVWGAYRTLMAAKRTAERAAVASEPAFTGDKLEIDQEESRMLADEIGAEIEVAGPDDVDAILAKINENVDRLDAVSAFRLAWRAGARRLKRSEADPTAPPAGDRVVLDDDFEEHRAKTLRILREVAT